MQDNEKGLLEKARQLVTHLENKEKQEADAVLEELTSEREMKLFQEIGQLTRELHNNLSSFAMDGNVLNLKDKAIPDAKKRLNYVIEMTEDAANRTLNAIDEIEPVTSDMERSSQALSKKWNKFMGRTLSVEEFKVMAKEISEYLEASSSNSKFVHEKFNEIVMAQGFQDLTGQIISKVITLVQEVEGSLVELVSLAGLHGKIADDSKEEVNNRLEGPTVPGLEVAGEVNSQDDVDDLLSSLGF